ncbi:MAG: hypothetical protein RIS70_4453 [Planctomycetota bacterium]
MQARVRFLPYVSILLAIPAAMAGIAASLLPPAPIARAEENSWRAALESITSSEIRSHVDFLADDSLEGREAGSRGGRAAGGYLATSFEKAKLAPCGDKSESLGRVGYFQEFGSGLRNVLAILEGSDPELRREVILIGAHYDHVGYGTRRTSLGPYGFVHNGADDNASGTSTLLEIIDAFQRLPTPPKRSILFAFWDGEEQGLLGSKHWIANSTLPTDKKMVFAVNIDMVGRLRDQKVEVFGTRSSRGLRQLLSYKNDESQLEMDFTWEMTPNSDHYTFYAQSIPVLMLFTGLHDDYHRPSDDADKVNTEGAQAIGRVLFSTAYEIAENGLPSGFRVASRNENPAARQQFEKPQPLVGPRLGITWERSGESIAVRSVQPGSAAARVGMLVGDQLLKFNGRPVSSEEQLRIDILAARNPVSMTVMRSGQTVPVEVTGNLDGNPIRVGVVWREDDAEPGTVTVLSVIPGSAADSAGIRERDRIYAVGGQPFKNGDEFQQRINTLPGPMEVLIERRGRLATLKIDVPPAVLLD